MNQSEFFQAHAVNGELSPAQMAEMLTLPEGDIPGASPSADVDDDTGKTQGQDGGTPPAATPAPEGDKPQVILAKDGVHTIPFSKLEEAREGERAAKDEAAAAKARAADLERQLEEARKAPAAAAPAPAAEPGTDPAAAARAQGSEQQGQTLDPTIFGDYSDEALAKGIEKLVEMRVAPLKAELERVKGTVAPVEQQRQIDATEAHFTTIYEAHPNLDSMLESAELEAWIKKQPSFAQQAYRHTLEQGTAAEVIEMFDAFTGKTRGQPQQDTAAQAAAKAAEAIANAKTAPPTSLSEIPAGAAAHHDEAQAMFEMTPGALMNKLDGKSPEQIAAILDRAL